MFNRFNVYGPNHGPFIVLWLLEWFIYRTVINISYIVSGRIHLYRIFARQQRYFPFPTNSHLNFYLWMDDFCVWYCFTTAPASSPYSLIYHTINQFPIGSCNQSVQLNVNGIEAVVVVAIFYWDLKEPELFTHLTASIMWKWFMTYEFLLL